MDIMEGARSAPEPGKARGKGRQVAEEGGEYGVLEPHKLAARLKQLEAQMYQHARDLEFEQAGRIRDEMQRLKHASLASPI
jgi:excinuclease ABC subunit B